MTFSLDLVSQLRRARDLPANPDGIRVTLGPDSFSGNLSVHDRAVVALFLDAIEGEELLRREACCEGCVRYMKPSFWRIDALARLGRAALASPAGSLAAIFFETIIAAARQFRDYERTLRPDNARNTPWPADGHLDYLTAVHTVQREVERSVQQLARLVDRAAGSGNEYRYAAEPRWEAPTADDRAAIRSDRHVLVPDPDPATRRLHAAIRRGDLAAVETLLAQGADVHAIDSAGRTMLELAEERGDSTLLELIRGAYDH